ncbi:helix-turn-helix domain-containing protein [Paenibacillus lupini]|uniref:ATP synthase beta subunit C-terminal domain-containing protein n=1 Tax=Paenibacillus lupini TaxID=1450204 RepID=UPI0014216CAD|nr:helix-turn-helix domain-containing protein [Paenibacillus lupini]NIK25073.1 F-type H+-transporting ATPase subunit beta [Paenibacillus lupini]
MDEELQLNVPLLRRRVPNLTSAARAAGLRAATVSNLCTGKIPVGRAEVRTLVALATLAGCSLDELIIRGSGMRMIETGIKALDLMAPVVRGGTVGFVARPNMGQLVLLAEFMHRLNKRGYATIFWDPGTDAPGINHVKEQSEFVLSTRDEVYKQIVNLREEKDILLGVDRSTVLSGELLILRDSLKEAGARPITVALVDMAYEAADGSATDAYGPLDTLLRFDTDLISRGIYPAIDPIVSTSTILEGSYLDAVHLTIQQRARKLLRRYRELRSLVSVHGIEKIADSDVQLYNRGERLESYLAQPFFVSEPYTQKPGEWLPLYDTLEDVKRILDGELDDTEASELFFKGRLEVRS